MSRAGQSGGGEARGVKVKRRSLLESEKVELEDFCRLFLVNAIHDYCYLMGITYALHGGAALVMFGAVPRRTFDVDMLVDRPELLAHGLDVVAAVVSDNFREMGVDADISLRSSGECDSSILRWKLSCALDNVIGSAHAKVEFWAASRDYILGRIESGDFVSATMQKPLHLIGNSGLINDKLVAILSRPYTKWGDYFDLAYLIHDVSPEVTQRCIEKFIDHASIYDGPSILSMASKIDEILEMPDEDMSKLIGSSVEHVPSERGVVVFDHEEVMSGAPRKIKSLLEGLKQNLLNRSPESDGPERESNL